MMKRKKRLPISPARVKALALKYELLTEAAAVVDTEPGLIELLEREPDLAGAWERGQLLRRLWIAGRECFAPSQVPRLLGIGHATFKKLVTEDREAAQLWTEARLHLRIGIKRRVLASVERGKVSTFNLLKLINGLYDLRNRSEEPADDIYHVHPKRLSKLLGVSRQTLERWRKRHGLQRNADNKTYDLRVVLPWLRRWERREITRKPRRSQRNVLPTS